MEKDSKIQIRDLLPSDYNNGFINVLSHLTEAGNITEEMFISQYDLLKYKKDYKIVVAIDTTTQKVVGTGTLFVEHKFIRSLASKGHIEDIVVLPDYRGQHIGQNIIRTLVDCSISLKCYKTALCARDEAVEFYKKCGFQPSEREMVIYHSK